MCGYHTQQKAKINPAYKKKLTSCRTTAPVMKQLLSDITQLFAGHCPISGANIQDWLELRLLFTNILLLLLIMLE